MGSHFPVNEENSVNFEQTGKVGGILNTRKSRVILPPNTRKVR